jgi:hypothetical protein
MKLACSAASKTAKKSGLHLYLRLRTERDVVFKCDYRTSIGRPPAVAEDLLNHNKAGPALRQPLYSLTGLLLPTAALQPDWASAAVFIGFAPDIRQLLSKARAFPLTIKFIFVLFSSRHPTKIWDFTG